MEQLLVNDIVKTKLIDCSGPITIELRIDINQYVTLLRQYDMSSYKRDAAQLRLLSLGHNSPQCSQMKEELELLEHQTTINQLNFEKERKGIGKELSGLLGDMHWHSVMELLLKALSEGTPAELDFANQLKDEAILTPLLIDCLHVSFIEIIKNSVDAMTVRHRKGNEAPPVVTIKCSFELKSDSTMEVIIRDNSGGFSSDYLTNIEAYLEQKHYLFERQDTAKDNKIYFGGSGKGMRMLYAMLLDGKNLAPDGIFDYCDARSCQNSAVHISNSAIGAVIRIIGTVKPLIPCGVEAFEKIDAQASSPKDSLSVYGWFAKNEIPALDAAPTQHRNKHTIASAPPLDL